MPTLDAAVHGVESSLRRKIAEALEQKGSDRDLRVAIANALEQEDGPLLSSMVVQSQRRRSRKTSADASALAVTVTWLATALGGVVSKELLYKQIREGRIKAVRLGRKVVIPRSEVQRLFPEALA